MTIKNEPTPNEDETIQERLVEHFGYDLLFADNFDAAIIGVSTGCDAGRVVYSAKKMAEVLVQNDDMSYEEAWEFLEFNTFNAYVKNAPIYFEELDDEY